MGEIKDMVLNQHTSSQSSSKKSRENNSANVSASRSKLENLPIGKCPECNSNITSSHR